MIHKIPEASALFEEIRNSDYADSCSVFLNRTDVGSQELIAAFFQSGPAWVGWLFQIRNRIVSLFGLKTGQSESQDDRPPYEVGRSIGLFRILGLTESEAILGEDDRHLDFRISLMVQPCGKGSELILSTIEKNNNWLGVVYFSIVKHFHRLIVPAMVRAMAKRIDHHPFPG